MFLNQYILCLDKVSGMKKRKSEENRDSDETRILPFSKSLSFIGKKGGEQMMKKRQIPSSRPKWMLQESGLVCWETELLYNISPTIYNKEKEQSQKDKSASKGTDSPVLWQVRESGGMTTDSPLTPRCLRFPPSRGGSGPHRRKDDAP